MRDVGLLLIGIGWVISVPVVLMYLGVRVGRLVRLGDPNNERIKLVGPSVADLEQVATERLLSRLLRPALLLIVVCVTAGALLMLLAN